MLYTTPQVVEIGGERLKPPWSANVGLLVIIPCQNYPDTENHGKVYIYSDRMLKYLIEQSKCSTKHIPKKSLNKN